MNATKATEQTLKQLGILEKDTAKFILRSAAKEKEPHKFIEKVVRILLGEAMGFQYMPNDVYIDQTCGDRFLQEIYGKALE